MRRSVPCLLALLVVVGCGKPNEWVVSAENKGGAPCSVSLVMKGGSSKAHVDQLAPGRPHELVSGTTLAVLESIKVVRGKEEQTLSPNLSLEQGRRYTIVVNADGKVDVSMEP